MRLFTGSNIRIPRVGSTYGTFRLIIGNTESAVRICARSCCTCCATHLLTALFDSCRNPHRPNPKVISGVLSSAVCRRLLFRGFLWPIESRPSSSWTPRVSTLISLFLRRVSGHLSTFGCSSCLTATKNGTRRLCGINEINPILRRWRKVRQCIHVGHRRSYSCSVPNLPWYLELCLFRRA